MLPRCNCRLPRFSPYPALPWHCPVCLGHKSKEQIAAAKAVKANKPKCRRNKLANVMDATRRGKYSRQGVRCGATASGVVALLRSSFPSLSLWRTIVVLVVAKMKMQMLMHCPIGQTLAAESRLTLSLSLLCATRGQLLITSTIHIIRACGWQEEEGWGLVNLSELWQRAISKILYHVISFGAATLLCHRLWPTSIGLNSLYCPPSLSFPGCLSLSLLNCNIQFELNEQVEILLLHCHSLFFFCQVSVHPSLSLPPLLQILIYDVLRAYIVAMASSTSATAPQNV